MAKFNQLPAFLYSPVEVSGYSDNKDTGNNFRNPFVNLGDKIKLHSKSGTYKIVELDDWSFTVTDINHKWFIKRMKQYKCTWDDFRCWARKV
ncbi:hypothetical protein GCM10027566_06580 [Arachidicoccus ginsenosidivorans]|jgi:hypothetical protein|uniref:Uncharacterized protein n=1 Tax=Arachidicoccus ginsenosidivorans TaxID=496057 RepID=A0A5B8VQN7_9BACT|nr:hypothetical protein [Arachidicoccus ginsenosidivorans]QEC73964.1 hypothetical protein FSB73_22125 [Arachidicoccus ginsenosidivorans]